MDETRARALASEWIAAWNDHDLKRIFALYTDDFVMTSPLITERGFSTTGSLRGKEQIRPYWSEGLAAHPPLRFELLEVFVGVESVTLYYRSVGRKLVCEVLFVNAEYRIFRGISHHGPLA